MDIDQILTMDVNNGAAPLSASLNNKGAPMSQHIAAAVSSGQSLDVACTEVTLPQSSAAHTPPAMQNEDDGEATKVISTPQAPCAQMRFDTLDEALRHYKLYAKRRGFGIRYNYRKKSEVTGEYIRAGIVCHMAGRPAKEKEDTHNPKPVVEERNKSTHPRTDCKARMLIKLRGESWVVTDFCDDHNHPLIKKWSLTSFLRSHREIPQEDQDFIKVLHSVNMETSRMMQVMATLYESLEGVPYTSRDVANFRAKPREEHKYTDLQDTFEYFEKIKKQDPDFFYRFDLDDEDRVDKLFWVDGAARRAYRFYNDCISFDTTYMTNTYKMPFAPFIGINSHGQSIQFGCGFLRNELTTSYTWLFETFLLAMDGLHPVNIITDQDFAMRSAIDEVFPDATHRNCRWHIVDKALEEVGPFLAGNEALRLELNDCINCSLTPGEFEGRWNNMIDTYEVRDHAKIDALYEKRSYWVPAYFMHDFYPFLQTMQRSEGFNAVLKKYVSPANSVLELAVQYVAIQAKIMKAENEQEAESSLTTARTWCYHPIEQHMSRVYTRKIYYRFQAEMQATMCYNISQTADKTYLLECITEFVPHYHNKTYQVHADPVNGQYNCACCKFERDGIVCCHILKTMFHLGVTVMPPAYVLKRWTWSAEENLVEEMPGEPAVMPEESRKKMSLEVMCNEFKSLANYGNQTEDGKKIIRNHLEAMKKDLNALKTETEKRAKGAVASFAPTNQQAPPNGSAHQEGSTPHVPMQHATSGTQSRATKRKKTATSTSAPTRGPMHATMPASSETSQAPNIRDPPRSSTKGRKKKQAFQNPLNIDSKEGRACRQCGSTKHDMRTCPERGQLPEQN